MVSDMRAIANRENSQGSMGPSSPRGKSKSAANSAKHNFAGNGLAMTEKDAGRFLLCLQRWMNELRPSNVLEERCVRDMALASFQLDGIAHALVRKSREEMDQYLFNHVLQRSRQALQIVDETLIRGLGPGWLREELLASGRCVDALLTILRDLHERVRCARKLSRSSWQRLQGVLEFLEPDSETDDQADAHSTNIAHHASDIILAMRERQKLTRSLSDEDRTVLLRWIADGQAELEARVPALEHQERIVLKACMESALIARETTGNQLLTRYQRDAQRRFSRAKLELERLRGGILEAIPRSRRLGGWSLAELEREGEGESPQNLPGLAANQPVVDTAIAARLAAVSHPSPSPSPLLSSTQTPPSSSSSAVHAIEVSSPIEPTATTTIRPMFAVKESATPHTTYPTAPSDPRPAVANAVAIASSGGCDEMTSSQNGFVPSTPACSGLTEHPSRGVSRKLEQERRAIERKQRKRDRSRSAS